MRNLPTDKNAIATPRLDPIDLIARLDAEHARYERNARRCGYWPYKTSRVLFIERILTNNNNNLPAAYPSGSPRRSGQKAVR